MSDIPVSKKYLHDLKELYTKYEEKQITDDEFSQRSDALKKEEAQLQEPMGHVLLIQKLDEIEKEIENEIKQNLELNKQELAMKDKAEQVKQAMQRRQQLLDQQNEAKKLHDRDLQKERERNTFRKEANSYIDHLESNTKNWQFRYTWLQIILLTFSAGTAAMASIDGIPRWIVSVAGLIATIAGSLLTTFKIQDRIYASRKAVTEVKLECQKYDYHLDEYNDIDMEKAFITFSRAIGNIKGQEMLQEVELWNPKQDDKLTSKDGTQRSLPPAKEKSDEQKSAEEPQNEEQEQVKKDVNEEQS